MVLCLPDSWSNWNLEMLVFEERGKPEYPEKNHSEQGREPKTNSTHIWCWRWDLNPAKLVGGECSHHCATLAPWKQGRLLNRASKITNFPPDFLFTSERPHYSLALISSFICTCTTSKRNKFYSKRTLDYLPKKYPEYAINWLVSQIAVRAETVNVTVHPLGCNT